MSKEKMGGREGEIRISLMKDFKELDSFMTIDL
jgi:hypothetical protein